MADNTNVNNNAAVVVVGRTAPVPPGQQKSEKSLPVVIASDQSTIPVAEQNKVQSEVALSLLGIPRSEVALGIFADVNTYDVNPTEWTSTPEQYGQVSAGTTTVYTGAGSTIMGWGLTHVPEESGALVEAPPDKSAVLTSKRFFRYQPGRVSAATFGVKTTVIESSGVGIGNPAIRKYGIFDNYDGYYWETRNSGKGDNFCVVRRTQSITPSNPLPFPTSQEDDYGVTNPLDPTAPRASESLPGEGSPSLPTDPPTTPDGYKNQEFGHLVIIRDSLLMTHAGVYDPSLLQPESKVSISTVSSGYVLEIPNATKQITHTTYDIQTGLMVITTSDSHEFHLGKFLTLYDITMTCNVTGSPVNKTYPNRKDGYNVVGINSATQFVVNVGVSTVPTTYVSGGWAVGLSTGQHVRYTKGINEDVIGGLSDEQIYKLNGITVDTSSGICTASLIAVSASGEQVVTGLTNGTSYTNHSLVTPVPFLLPIAKNLTTLVGRGSTVTNNSHEAYATLETNDANVDSAGTGMFPYVYEDNSGNTEGYIDTRASSSTELATLAVEVDKVNNAFYKWVNQNVHIDFWNVYEYRVPRSRFSGDRLDSLTDTLLFSDAVSTDKPGSIVIDPNTGEAVTDTSIWDLDFTKVTMYKVEFSWYGAVGAMFLAYVPVGAGEARWVRVHHLRASNQLKIASLGNATLPITYMVYGGGNPNCLGYANNLRLETQYNSASDHIVKYGASYYIDGGDRGTVKLFSHATDTTIDIYGSKRTFVVGTGATHVGLTTASSSSEQPYIYANSNSGLSTTFYVGAKVITGQALDQNIRIDHVGISSNRLYLNAPLSTTSLSTITIIPDRPISLIGLKCRDFIQSSTGQSVRNRTQVYPTRLSTGSSGQIVKVDLLKTPIFQTDHIITNNTGPVIPTLTNIGKRGRPTKVGLGLTAYIGTHTFVSGSSDLNNAIALFTNVNTKVAITNVAYNSGTGKLTVTAASGSFSPGTQIRVLKESLTFKCSLDNFATEHSYPRVIDPIFDGTASLGGTDFNGAVVNDSAGRQYSRPVRLLTGTSGTTLVFSVTSDTSSNTVADVPSAAEYIRDIGKGTYGWFRGFFNNDASQKKFGVLGYLENRGSDRTKGIEDDGYYFYALDASEDEIVLMALEPFLRETDVSPVGTPLTPTVSEFTLDSLSSILVSDENRSPIPGTGTVVATIFVPATGDEFDLSSYFDYNKEYLSFPLTNKIESLYLMASCSKNYEAADPAASTAASLTWEEQ